MTCTHVLCPPRAPRAQELTSRAGTSGTLSDPSQKTLHSACFSATAPDRPPPPPHTRPANAVRNPATCNINKIKRGRTFRQGHNKLLRLLWRAGKQNDPICDSGHFIPLRLQRSKYSVSALTRCLAAISAPRCTRRRNAAAQPCIT